MEWEDFDPGWLIKLAAAQAPKEIWLQEALAKCTRQLRVDENTIYFVDRMEGRFFRNIVLFWPEHGKVVLDLLEDGRIGGMSLFTMAFDHSQYSDD